ncbi:DUF4933 domain-containing protein [Parabacteroides bouchesdurhonensis]|uniref:DUF4933 domain-containing protein n=1 Tax=Parabacteroides bouchesdurhonensis TaxID=1936995 RepID=UPI000C82915B|nr:DUF4933 domain-containing protein [Parabacteroides bouchesdurhonensis]
MKKKSIYLFISVLSLILLLDGCLSKQAEQNEGDGNTTVVHRSPKSPLYTAQTDNSRPVVSISVENAIQSQPATLRLSQIASSVEYYAVGDDKYQVTQILKVPEGFIALNKPKIYLYRKGMKRKRVGFKAEYSEWAASLVGNSLYYDSESGQLYGYIKRLEKDQAYRTYYIGEMPKLDSILARQRYLFIDSLPNLYPVPYLPGDYSDPLLDFNEKGYAKFSTMPQITYIPNGILTFNLQGDTLCRFPAGMDPFPKKLPDQYRHTDYATAYSYDKQLTFKITYSDTIYRIASPNILIPAYHLDFGKHKASASYIFSRQEMQHKAWLTDLKENQYALFLGVHYEGKRTYEGWLDKNSERDTASPEYRIVYLKKSRQAVVLPEKDYAFINDLDGGLPFWPDGQADGYFYMIRPAKELKKEIRLDGSPRQKELAAFLKDLPDDQNVLMVVH